MSILLLLLFSWIILFLIFYRYHSGNYYKRENFETANNLIDKSGVLSNADTEANEEVNSTEPALPPMPINVQSSNEIKNDFVQQNTQVEKEPDVKNCLFVPRGDNLQSCIDRCQFIEDRNLWGGKNCTNNNCTKICVDCKNKDHCKWIRKDSRYEEATIPNPPPKQEIIAIPGNSNTKILWNSLENDNSKNTAFLIKYFKTYKPFEGVRVANVLVESEGQKNFSYTLENLENNEYYSIGVFAINDTDMGPCSNIEQIVPKENRKIISK